MTIDAHHHFWQFDPGEYGWISQDMATLRNDFGPPELKPLISEAGVDGVISVQARTNREENEFLLGYASENDFIKGVVGYIDLCSENARGELEAFSSEAKFVGVREVLQGMEDDAYCLRDDFNRGVSLLHDFGLVYDILIFHRHLPNAIRFADRHPDQRFVLDHIAKPDIQSSTPDPEWAGNLAELAKRENVSCKISGMVTEVASSIEWDADLLRPYFEVAWEAFGAERLMFGSDWPVCLLRSGYRHWVETVRSWTDSLSDSEQAAFWGETAASCYGLR